MHRCVAFGHVCVRWRVCAMRECRWLSRGHAVRTRTVNWFIIVLTLWLPHANNVPADVGASVRDHEDLLPQLRER